MFGLMTAQAQAATPYSASIYWGLGAGNTVGKATVDATNTPPAVNYALVAGPCGLQNSTSVSSTVIVSNGNQTDVCAMDPDGTNKRDLTATYCNYLIAGTLATDQYVYYTCRENQWIGRVNVDGTNSIPHFAYSPYGSGRTAYGMAIDANWLYIGYFGGDIRRVPVDGGTADPAFAVDAQAGSQIAVDAGHLYWTRTGSTPKIGRSNLDGTGIDRDWLDTGQTQHFDSDSTGVAVDGTYIYWLNTAGNLGRAQIDGSNANPTLITGIGTPGRNDDNSQLSIVGSTSPVGAPGAALSNSVVPVITGTVAVGETVTADAGTWSATPDEVYYEWQVSSDGQTWDIAPGTGAATNTYTPVRADLTKRLRVKVRAGATGGLLTTIYSNEQVVPLPSPPVSTVAPAISGTPAPGAGITATAGSWTNPVPASGDLTYAYQWQTSADGSTGWTDVAGVRGTTLVYLVTAADATAGTYLRLRVIASNGSETVAYSATVQASGTAQLSRIYWREGSALADGSALVPHTDPGGVYGFSSNGETNAFGGWDDLMTRPAAGGATTGLVRLHTFTLLIDSTYVYYLLGNDIGRIGIDGTGRNDAFITGCNGSARGMAIAGGYLYFAWGNVVGRAPIAGSSSPDCNLFSDLSQQPQSVAVDGDYIYWSYGGSTINSTHWIGRADITGSGVEATWADIGSASAYGLGVDQYAVYFADQASQGGSKGIGRVGLDGTGSARIMSAPDPHQISVIPDPASVHATPVNGGSDDAPAISGTPLMGNTLTTTHGAWSNTPASYTYRWLVSDDGATGWSAATGVMGTTTSYTIPDGYGGKYLRARVIAHNGSTWSDAAYSASVWVPGPPVSTVVPAVAGTPMVGETLTATHGTWSNAPETDAGYAYEWQVSADRQVWTAALGEGGDTAEYDVDLTDDNKYLRVKVSATNEVGTEVAFSDATSLVDILAPTSSDVPQITGTVEIGSSLTASTGTWDFATDYAYVWESSADGSTWETAPGTGATTSSYTIAAADAGRYLRVRVTGSNRIDSLVLESDASVRVPSPASPVVPPVVTPPPVFSPAPGITVGETRGEAVLAAAVPAATTDLLRGANIWVNPSSKVTYVASSLPKGLKLVNGKLVATKPGTYKVQMKVKRKNGTIVIRTIKIKVG